MEMRTYQTSLLKDVKSAFRRSNSVLLQAPTGSGKTTIAAAVIKNEMLAKRPVWFVCHRQEILSQASEELRQFKIKHSVVASGVDVDATALVQVCSIGALPRRADKLLPPKLIIWDECHHVASPSWSALKERFPDSRHLGLTATPARLDGVGLEGWFDTLIIGPSTRDLIDGGWLSNFRIFAPSVPDLRGVRAIKGDFKRADLGAAMDKPALVGDAISHYKRLVPNARAVVFAASVEASKNVANRFIAAGVKAAHIDAKTPDDERKAAIAALTEGRIKVLCNVELFTEGFNCPAVDALILLRPTKSTALYLQMIGRGLRTYPGKAETVILDHSGLVYMHGMPDAGIDWSLRGDMPRLTPGGVGMRRCPECTALHEWAAECPECGHVYSETDRTIEEVYGELVEIDAGYERQKRFSERTGIDYKVISRYVKQGMPTGSTGLVAIEESLKWIANRTAPPPLKAARVLGVGKFAESQGVSPRSVRKWILKGMPTDDGRVDEKLAIAWMEKNVNRKLCSAWRPSVYCGEKTLNIIEFSALTGIPKNAISDSIKKGLPTSSDGRIPELSGRKWLADNYRSRGCPPTDEDKPNLFEASEDFERRVGWWRGATWKYRQRGLPHASNGWIHIEKGLEWVSKHTDVKMPKSAHRETNRKS